MKKEIEMMVEERSGRHFVGGEEEEVAVFFVCFFMEGTLERP